MAVDVVTKLVVSVTEMARMVGLSRARFYQLVRSGTFPVADHDPLTKRPYYGEEKQRQCLEVRRKNCGIDGSPVLFYSRRRDAGVTKVKSPPPKPKANADEYADLMEHLTLARVTVARAQVEVIVKAIYPGGIKGIDLGTVVRKVIDRLRCQNSTGSVG